MKTVAIAAPDFCPSSMPPSLHTRPGARFYRPELDVLRFFAFLLVFVHHSLFLEKGLPIPLFDRTVVAIRDVGAFGVCLFFLLSAFLITELLSRECEAKGKIDVRAFYLRRIFRIWPLYFSFLAFCGMIGWLVPSRQAETWRYVSFIFLSGNWYCAFFGYTLNPMSPLWSVSVEEQFYLLWPTVARFNSKRLLLFVAILIIVVSNCSLLYLGMHHAERNYGVWTNSFVQFYFFALGAILSLLLKGRIPFHSAKLRLGSIIVGLLSWFAASAMFRVITGPSATVTDLLGGYLCIAFGSVMVFLGVLGVPSRFLPAFLIYLGKISYGLYVFHSFAGITTGRLSQLRHFSWLRGGGTTCLFSFGLTVVIASVSYRWLEAPFLRMKRTFTIVESRPV